MAANTFVSNMVEYTRESGSFPLDTCLFCCNKKMYVVDVEEKLNKIIQLSTLLKFGNITKDTLGLACS